MRSLGCRLSCTRAARRRRRRSAAAALTTAPPSPRPRPRRQRQLLPLGARVPSLAPCALVAPSAVLAGDVDVLDGASVGAGAVLRGDLNAIRVGAFSSIGDRAVLHAARSSPTGLPAATVVGRHVTVGAGALLRSATLADECVVGDRCVLLEGSVVEKHAVLAPGSVLPPGRRVPGGELWAGAPARRVRALTKDEIAAIAPLAAAQRPAAERAAAEYLPESGAWREAEALAAILKPDSALARSRDIAAVAAAAHAAADELLSNAH